MIEQATSSFTLYALAEKSAGKYDWASAIALYRDALRHGSDYYSAVDTAKIIELLGRSSYKAGFQAENRLDFKRSLELASLSFQDAALKYQKLSLKPFERICQARSLFAHFWTLDAFLERKDAIEKCLVAAEEAVQLFRAAGDEKLAAETEKDLLNYLIESLVFESDIASVESKFQKILLLSQQILSRDHGIGQDEVLLESLHMTLLVVLLGANLFVDPVRFRELSKTSSHLISDLDEVAKRIGRPHALAMANEVLAWRAQSIEGDSAKALELFQSAILEAEKTRDSYLIGRGQAGAVIIAAWLGLTGELVEDRRKSLLEGIRLASKAIDHLAVPYHGAWLAGVYTSLASCYTHMAIFVDTAKEEKRARLSQATAYARKGLEYQDHRWVSDPRHELSKALHFYATLENDPITKEQQLIKALEYRQAELKTRLEFSARSWDSGVSYNYLALLEAELSTTVRDSPSRVELLRKAQADMEECLERCSKWATNPRVTQALAQYTEWYGDLLCRLHSLTKEDLSAQKAIAAYQEAKKQLGQLGELGPLGPLQWKIARVLDEIGNYPEAGRAFNSASAAYKSASLKIPTLTFAFGEFSAYMAVWAQIEEARAHHAQERYSSAAEKYRTAASILQRTQNWNHLAAHFRACSLLEEGEEQSCLEKHEQSVRLIQEASVGFSDAASQIEYRLAITLDMSNREELRSWLETSKARQRLSDARVRLEAAKVLDMKGDLACLAEYRSASDSFRELAIGASSDQTKREMETLALCCDAWTKMKEAEQDPSPQTYADAAARFSSAATIAPSNKSRLLALASESVARAMESGATFLRTRDVQLYPGIKRNLETANAYYARAGFKNASVWTTATKRLFDAIIFIADAEVVRDPARKTELYHLAENHLLLSANLFDKAGHVRMREEALRELEAVREEKELLLIPIKVLSIKPSDTLALSPVTLLRDHAREIENLDEARIIGKLNLSRNMVDPGSEICAGIEVTNIGKSTATLIKLEKITVPGLQLVTKKFPSGIEQHSIDLQGIKLGYLRSHAFEVPIRAATSGEFRLHPRILFVDDKGNHRSVELPPTFVWVGGLSSTSSGVSSPMMEYLAKAFVDDYMMKRLSIEHAGWRSLMDIVDALKIPKSQVYGDPRSGHTFGKPLGNLVRAGIVEHRIVPGARGRGGNVMKVRVAYEREPVKEFVNLFALKPLEPE